MPRRWVARCVTILVGAALLLPCQSLADELTVDCSGGTPGAHTSIRDAIAALGPGGPTPPSSFHERHVITVLSDCMESVPVYDRQGLTIRAPLGQSVTITSPAPGGAVFYIGGSQGIKLERLVIRGALLGIWVFDSSEVDILDCTIEDNSADGLNVQGGSVAFLIGYEFPDWSAIRNNGGWGVSTYHASQVVAWGTTIEGNAGGGLGLLPGGTAWLSGAMLIRNNGTEGEPGSAGIGLSGGSTLFARGQGNEITGNHGPGILADVNSTLRVDNGRIENNTGDGVRVLHMSIAQFGAGNTLGGNGAASIYCDSTSMAFGDLGEIEGMDCDTVELQVTLCHVPPGNPANARTILVDESAVASHLAHGDTLGPCSGGGARNEGIDGGGNAVGLIDLAPGSSENRQAGPSGTAAGDREKAARMPRRERSAGRSRGNAD